MKWLKVPAAILFLIAALFFAYTRFESSFNPRRGQGPGGPPPMTANMKSVMAKHNAKLAAAKKSGDKKPGAKHALQASVPDAATNKQTSTKGGD